jgi:hypothetical protein
MPISWNEIRDNALAFSREWAGAVRERSEAQTFWNEFFEVFGVRRRVVGRFEEPVRNIRGTYGFIDLFWPGTLLAESKSRGESLDKAHTQANAYVRDLINEGRQEEVPQFIIVTDFARVAIHNLDDDTSFDFPTSELYQQVNRFAFIPGYRQLRLDPEDPVNIEAVEIMGELHDALEAGGYTGDDLERLLVRILFCLFAEDTGIFERCAFQLYIENHTEEDGIDLGLHLAQLFNVLNTPPERRQQNLREELAELPYVNGDLYADTLAFADFNREMRDALLKCTRFDWSRISPAVFGALFQSVMEPPERRQVGAHYTSERDILKLIGPLFLDGLKDELNRSGNDRDSLRRLHRRLVGMRLLDPACGCGNFLVVSYRELRLLELEILRRLMRGQQVHDVGTIVKLDVNQMYGIEIEEWPARIAEVAMWLIDHQMNQRLSEAFGENFVRLPLRSSPHIHNGNALSFEWNNLLPAAECSHVLGNPPFVGKRFRSPAQRADHSEVWAGVSGAGVLDYVACWYRLAAKYIAQTPITVGFVSTNSIAKGEQVGILWNEMYRFENLSIRYAHRTFAWESEARGRAHVHVVIIGFGPRDNSRRRLFDYENPIADPTEIGVSNINPYLVEGPELAVLKRSRPLCDVYPISFGSMPNDGGALILDVGAYEELVATDSPVLAYVRPFMGSEELIQGIRRWCLWLRDASPEEFRGIPFVRERLERVRETRRASPRETTRELASRPFLFGEDRQPNSDYIAIPKTSSEQRRYIPIAIVNASTIANTELFTIETTDLYTFGVLTSSMHMAWVRYVGGTLESRYRYSSGLVYNTFPWPDAPGEDRQTDIRVAVQAVLAARAARPGATLAALYDPLAMPADLADAHARLDRAVDRCYRSQPFPHERNRVEFLLGLYQTRIAPLLPATGRRPARRNP